MSKEQQQQQQEEEEACPRVCKLGPCKPGDRRCEGLDEQLEALRPSKTDWYGMRSRRQVLSMEELAEIEEDLKQAIDKGVIMENQYGSGPPDKRPPCQRRKGSFHS